MVDFRSSPDAAPEAAMIVCVHSDTCVNLAVWNSTGSQRSETSVQLKDDATTGSSWAWPTRD